MKKLAQLKREYNIMRKKFLKVTSEHEAYCIFWNIKKLEYQISKLEKC